MQNTLNLIFLCFILVLLMRVYFHFLRQLLTLMGERILSFNKILKLSTRLVTI